MSEQNRPGHETGQQGPIQYPAYPTYETYGQPVNQYGGTPHAVGGPAATQQLPSWQQPGEQLGDGGQLPPSSGGVPPVFVAPPARRAGRARLVVAALLAGALIGGGTGAGVVALTDDHGSSTAPVAAAQNVVITDPQTATSSTAAAAKAAPSVVTIYVSGSQSSGSGSGIVLSADGYVLTNNHVVTLDSSTTTATVQVRTSDGTLYDATVVGTDPTSDLAVVKLTDASGLTPATFADSDKVQVGDLAVAIGAPLGLENTVTDGIISATNRAVATGSDTNVAVIEALQTDAAINPGNSGGALVDAAGEVIGVNSAIASVATADVSGQQTTQSGNIGVGFAIPSNQAQRISQEIIQTGSATHAVLGVTPTTATNSRDSGIGLGATVSSLVANSPAANAGLEVGDVVTGVNDNLVENATDLTAAIRSSSPGTEVVITYVRDSETYSLQLTLGSASN